MAELVTTDHLLDLAQQTDAEIDEEIEKALGTVQPDRVHVTITRGEDGTNSADKTFAELTAAHAAGADLYCLNDAVYLSTDVQVIGHLTMANASFLVFNAVSGGYVFTTIIYSDGTIEVKSALSAAPSVTADDNGKFLRVMDGEWAAVALTDVSEVGA